MTPLIDSPANQNARQWSARLGVLAAQKAAPTHLPPRLTAILQSLRRRRNAAETFRANHFIQGD